MIIRSLTLIMMLLIVTPASVSLAQNHEGKIVVSNPWVKYNPMEGRPSAAYFDIENAGANDAVIVSVSAPDPIRAMMHNSKNNDGRTMMLHLESVNIAAGTSFSFAPRGAHIMLMDMPLGLEVGGHLIVNLMLSSGVSVDIPFKICPLTAMSIC